MDIARKAHIERLRVSNEAFEEILKDAGFNE